MAKTSHQHNRIQPKPWRKRLIPDTQGILVLAGLFTHTHTHPYTLPPSYHLGPPETFCWQMWFPDVGTNREGGLEQGTEFKIGG